MEHHQIKRSGVQLVLLLSCCVNLGRSLRSLIYNFCIPKIWIIISVHLFHKYWTYPTWHTSRKALRKHKWFCLKELTYVVWGSKFFVDKRLWYGICYNKDTWTSVRWKRKEFVQKWEWIIIKRGKLELSFKGKAGICQVSNDHWQRSFCEVYLEWEMFKIWQITVKSE